MKKMVYMDYNATAPVFPDVAQAMGDALMHVGNPSSVHQQGRTVRKLMEDARETLAKKLNVPTDWVFFTSGGTEADGLAIKGTGRQRILASAVEHAAVLSAGENIEQIPVDTNGIIDLNVLETMLEADDTPAVVSVMFANNETGVIQPISEVVEIAHKFGALVHCDAVQAISKIDVDMRALDLDMISVSAHKIGGPQGVGALVKRDSIAMKAQQAGGGQERSLRGGTENLSGIVGMGKALEIETDYKAVKELRDYLEEEISKLGAVIFGQAVARLPNTTYFAMKGLSSERQVMALDLAGVMVSAGSACSSGKVKASHVMKAMGVEDDLANCAIRISLGWNSTKDDVDFFVQAYAKLVERVQIRKAGASHAA